MAGDAHCFELNWVREQQQCSDSGKTDGLVLSSSQSLDELLVHIASCLFSLGICSSYCCMKWV